MPEITNNPSTWPTGNRLWDVARAIATAEGANVPGSNPDRLNNPGDLSDCFADFGGEEHSGSSVTHFPDKQTGWDTLYHKLDRIRLGKSTVYRPSDTWAQLARKWAGNWEPWLATTCQHLHCQPTDAVASVLA